MLRIAQDVAKGWSLAVAALACCAAANAQQKDQERFDLQTATPKGTTAWFVESANHEQVHQLGAMEVQYDFHVERTFGITILRVNAKGQRFARIVVARIRGWTQLGGSEKNAFDSEDKDNGGNTHGLGMWMHRMMATAGQSYIARIDKDGLPIGSMAGIAHEITDPNAKLSVSVQGWELADLAETAFGHPPGRPVALGDTWKFVQSGTDAMSAARHATMSLSKVTEDEFQMSLTGTVEKGNIPTPTAAQIKGEGPDSAAAEIRRIKESLKIHNGQLTGKQSLSRHDGLVIRAESTATYDVDLRRAGKNQTMQIVTKTTLRRTTRPDVKALAGPRRTVIEQAKFEKTLTDIKVIAEAVRMHVVKNGALPDSLAALTQPDAKGHSALQELPVDPWGGAYKLVRGQTPGEFRVVSAGPDGRHETADDICNRDKL